MWQWRDVAREVREGLAVVRAACSRMAVGALGGAWNRLLHHHALEVGRRAIEERLRRMVMHMGHAEVVGCWNMWRGRSAEARQAVELGRRVVKRMMDQSLGRAWCWWRAVVASEVHDAGMMRRAMMGMLKGHLSRALEMWRGVARTSGRV